MKRSREQKFGPREKEVLLEAIDTHKEILFGSLSMSITNKMKQETWESITQKVNAVNTGPARTSDKIQHKWVDWKSKTKVKLMNMKKERTKTGNNEPRPQDELTFEEKKILDIMGTKVIDGEEEGIDTMPALHTPAINYTTMLVQPEVHPLNLDIGSYNNEAEQSQNQSVHSMASCSPDLPTDMPLLYHNLDEQHQGQGVNSFIADDNPSNITSASPSTSKITFSNLPEMGYKKMKKANTENELVDIEKQKLQLMKDELKVKQDLLQTHKSIERHLKKISDILGMNKQDC